MSSSTFFCLSTILISVSNHKSLTFQINDIKFNWVGRVMPKMPRKNSRQIQTKIKAKTNFQCDYNRKGLKNHKKLKNKRFSGSKKTSVENEGEKFSIFLVVVIVIVCVSNK